MSVVCRYIIETDGWRQTGGDRQVETDGWRQAGGDRRVETDRCVNVKAGMRQVDLRRNSGYYGNN